MSLRASRKRAAVTEIEVTGRGHRGTLEALYLELRELAKKHGLKLEYRLSPNKPKGPPDS